MNLPGFCTIRSTLCGQGDAVDFLAEKLTRFRRTFLTVNERRDIFYREDGLFRIREANRKMEGALFKSAMELPVGFLE